MLTQETTHFRDDDTPREELNLSRRDPTFMLSYNPDANLGNFLERPIRITQYSWTPGSGLNVNFQPWSLFLADANVQDRLRKYYLLRGDLRVKAVVNGNSFYYGKAMLSYQPLNTHDGIYANSFAGVNEVGALMAQSQMPRVILDTTLSQGGELSLPFLYKQNWLNITTSDWTELGLMRLRSFVDLQHANGATDPLTISIFAWLENVELTIPTTNDPGSLSFQSEYGVGIVGKVASSISSTAKLLSAVPRIGPYARATDAWASTIGGVARTLGLSRPAILDSTKPYKPRFAGSMAVTDADEMVEKLSLDSKQELTIDPRTFGLTPEDEMDLSTVVMRESFLTSFGWSTTDVADGFLFNSYVCPTLCSFDVSTFSGADVVYPTPMSHAAQLFKYWSGDIIFRFSVVASAYHKGRLRITIDPAWFDDSAGPGWNAVYTRIVDISEERDFSVRVAWMQPEAYRDIDPVSNLTQHFSNAIKFVAAQSFSNGIITVEVLNDLTSPSVSSTDVNVLVFVQGAENMRLMNPTGDNVADLSVFDSVIPAPLEFQSGVDEGDVPGEVENADIDVAFSAPAVHVKAQDDMDLVYGGESVRSFRQLLKRYWFSRGNSRIGSTAGFMQVHNFNRPNFPPYRGYDFGAGMDVTGAAHAYNYVGQTALNYITPCYVLKRGGIRYKYYASASSDSILSDVGVVRTPVPITSYNALATVASTTSPSVTAALSISGLGDMGSGCTLTPTKVQPVVEVELPFYSKYRSSYARVTSTKGSYADDTNIMNHQIQVTLQDGTANASYVKAYVATAEDFALGLYLHAPAMYIIPDPSSA